MNWDKLKQDIDGHPSDVDAANIWAAIRPDVDALNKRRKKRHILWLWFFGFVVTGIGLGSYFYVFQEDTNSRTTISENSLINNSAIGGNDSQKEETCIDLESKSLTEQVDTENIAVVKKSSPFFEKESNKTSKDYLIANNSAGINNAKEKGFSIKENTPVTVQTASLNTPAVAIDTLLSKIDNTQKELSKPKKGLSFLNKSNIFSLLKMEEKENSLIDSLLDKKLNEPLKNTPPKDTTQPPVTLTVRGVSGLSYGFKNMTARENTSLDLLSLRQNTETALETSHLGIQATLQQRKGWFLTTGVQQTTINERFDYSLSDTEIDTIGQAEGIIAYAVNIHQDTFFITGVVPLSRTTTHLRKYYNSYKMLEIPLLFGKQKTVNNWTVGAQLGVFVNLSLKTKGRILENATTTKDLELEQISLFKSNVGASIYGGAFIQRDLSSHWRLRLSVNSRYFMKDFALDANPISQKYMLVGGNLGIGYTF